MSCGTALAHKDIMDRLERMDENRKQRVQHSHMELETAVRYLHKLDLSRCRCIYLLHLSGACSNEIRFMATFRREFPGTQILICEA